MTKKDGEGSAIWDQVEAVLNSGKQAGLAMTGGGSQALTWLLNHPGASRFVLEAQVPYHQRALAQYLQQAGPHPANSETARRMALRARHRAVEFAQTEQSAWGVGCTAALATRRARRGRDRGCIAIRLEREYHLYTLDFIKGAAARIEQEDVLSRYVLQALADAMGISASQACQWPEWLAISQASLPALIGLEALLDGRVDLVEARQDGSVASDVERRGRLLFSGSFNPYHEGHAGLAAAAAKRAGRPVSLELSVENVDKPSLSYEATYARIRQIGARLPTLVTRAPTFLEKARLFPACHFAVGYDTAVRLVEGKYYSGGEAGMEAALTEMAQNGCKFWVAGRLQGQDYLTLADIAIKADFQAMFEAIPEADFRADISSTQIRSERQGR